MTTDSPRGLPPQLDIDGAIATITLRRPDVANRLELSDLEQLRQQLAEVDAAPGVLVLRLRGTGRHFCSGFNIGEVGGSEAGARFEALAAALEAARPVTIAILNGGVYGGATDLALACDFRLGAPGCEMFVPAARLGLLFYRGGLERYVSRLGLGMAKRVLLAADKLDAQQMLDCGFLDKLLPDSAALEAEAGRLGGELAGMAPLALLGMKKHLNRIAAGQLDAGDIARDIALADASEDLAEGAQAWRERRAPRFHGR
ncbi:3-hydroxybutyryl-CoA dehydratase [Cupriavidus sp. USMAA2-4]|uniref:3-hydroxybutyryl-CoA dehydratase n=1 Tax=Cupriavidus malaysiensis TaxID=367825 RepID=A0ABN4TVF8_9BURK|nr:MULTISPECIES: enoyl-CoA hydratase/isomerase family protein [Cupriavidus]AOY96319.1 3-hydroxybutyryl-CoA dehydratase [Cupriavidus sp. USMAA2-4]AOZ03278.1 3-hydroxybutyryl-CoA dehydratase [Cupriavidus sp. USMAHM13]AOZ09360.1 3-hydroxybutyryl-CoA dehydratase [Cupriavidus malaysiensis]